MPFLRWLGRLCNLLFPRTLREIRDWRACPPPRGPAILQRSYKIATVCPACGGGPILRTALTGPLGVCEGCALILIVMLDGSARDPSPHSCGAYASDPQCTEARLLRIIVRERIATARALEPGLKPLKGGA